MNSLVLQNQRLVAFIAKVESYFPLRHKNLVHIFTLHFLKPNITISYARLDLPSSLFLRPNIFIRLSLSAMNAVMSIFAINLIRQFHARHHQLFSGDLKKYGTEFFFRSRQSLSCSRISRNVIEPEGSSRCSQEPSIGPYREPDEYSPHHHILSL
jgi:hypothetical protein